MERLRTFADGKTLIKLFNEINHATLDAIAIVFIFKRIRYIFILFIFKLIQDSLWYEYGFHKSER